MKPELVLALVFEVLTTKSGKNEQTRLLRSIRR
jgi:hypothetical protein